MDIRERTRRLAGGIAPTLLLFAGLTLAGTAPAQGVTERHLTAAPPGATVLTAQTLAPALAVWPRDPSAFQALSHRPVLLELVPVTDSPYFAVQGMAVAMARSAGAGRAMSAPDSNDGGSPLFVCPVAAPRFSGGLVATALDHYEVDGDSGHAFVHLTRCEAVLAP